MITAILAVVTAIVGMISGIVTGDKNFMALKRAEWEGNIQRAHEKEITWYNTFKSQQMVIAIVVVIGFVLIGFMIWQSKKSK